MFVAITGRPGVGKTTLFFKVLNAIKNRIKFYGFYCPEVREAGRRIGFKIVDLVTNREGWLAISLDKARALGYKIHGRKRIGRYVVIEEEAVDVGTKALAQRGELLAIDEIGPMELSIQSLRHAIIEALNFASKALLVIHRNLQDPDIVRILNNKKTRIFVVTEANRNDLLDQILRMLV